MASNRLILFEFANAPDYLNFQLVIAPAKKSRKEAFYKPVKSLAMSGHVNSWLKEDGYSAIIRRNLLHGEDYLEEDWAGIEKKIRDFWDKFVETDLERISKSVLAAFST
ncbi:MAG: hypothetical protein ACFB16_10115 [Phormidesmis sp.]